MTSPNDDHERIDVTADESVTNDPRGSDGDETCMHTIDIAESSPLDESRYRLLVPVLSENSIESVERIMRAAATIARDRKGNLLVLCVVDVPEQTPYEAMTNDQPRVHDAHEAAERLLRVTKETGVTAKGIVCLTHRRSKGILNNRGSIQV